MLDVVLGWAVLVIPVVLGVILIVVPAKHEDHKGHMRWRYALGASLLVYAAIAWWQQGRFAKASIKDREDAISKTTERVAAETSRQVTKAVSDLYSQIIADQKNQIASLETDLRKKPIKVEVTNPISVSGSATPSSAPVLTGIRIASQRQIPSDDQNLPFGLEVVVQTDVDIAPVKLAVLCDGPIGKGQAGFAEGGAYTMMTQGLANGNDHIFITKWETPAWTPHRAIIVQLFSKSSLHALSLSRNVF